MVTRTPADVMQASCRLPSGVVAFPARSACCKNVLRSGPVGNAGNPVGANSGDNAQF